MRSQTAVLVFLGLLIVGTVGAQTPNLATVEGVHLAWRPDAGLYGVRFHSATPQQNFQATWTDAEGAKHPAPITSAAPNYGGDSSAYGFRFPANATGYSINGRAFTIQAAPPAENDAVRIAWIADVGMTENTKNVLEAARASGVSAILAGGDLSYADGDEAIWDDWFTFMEPYISDIPFIPARGNHEARCHPVAAQNLVGECISDEQVYLDRFDLPLAALYYATEWGPLRIVVLDTEAYYPRDDPLGRTLNTDADEQRSFLADALRAPDGVWEIVMFHRPMYSSSGAHGSEFSIRDDLRDTLESGGADLVLNAHDHDYERTHVLRRDRPVAFGNVTNPDAGTVYVVSGGGGQSLYNSWQPTPDWSTVRTAAFHYTLIEADAERLTVTALQPDGTVLDQFTLLRGATMSSADETARAPLSVLVVPTALALALAFRRRLFTH